MPRLTTVLITNASWLKREVEQANEAVNDLNLEVSDRLESANQRLMGEDVALVLLHHTGAQPIHEIESVLQLARERSVATVVLADRYDDRDAVALLRSGASEYLGLPLGPGELVYLVDSLTIRARLAGRPAAPRHLGNTDPQSFEYFLVPNTNELMEQVHQVAPQDTTVLLTGETGTGKSRLARLIHELSPRRDKPFQVVDCAALSPTLIESEMFGHVKSAFTGADRDRVGKFAVAGQGTLLLDEINSLPLPLQSKLLRAVDDRVFEPVGSNRCVPLQARIIAVSNASLPQEVAAGRFRADLYYRLNVVEFYLSPLRERPAVTRHLANRFLSEFSSRNNRKVRGIAPEALRLFQNYSWPGNIREIRNAVERAVALCNDAEIQIKHVPETVRAPQAWSGANLFLAPTAEPLHTSSPNLAQVKETVEIERIGAALRKHRNNRLRAAAELGISRMGLYKKLHKYGMMKFA
jgi:two-component system response regulator HydG